MPVQHGMIGRISVVLQPDIRDEIHTRSFCLNCCWVVVFSEISQCSKADILPKPNVLGNCGKVQNIFPSVSLLKFSNLRRVSTCIWNSLPAKLDALRTSVLCEEALSYVSSYLYYCIFAELLYALCWLDFCLVQSPTHNESSIKYPWEQCRKTHHANSIQDLPGFCVRQ